MNKIVSANTLPISTILMGDYDYKIIEKLGQGGFGIVYKAENLTTGELVAIKEYFPSQLGISRDVTDGFNILLVGEKPASAQDRICLLYITATSKSKCIFNELTVSKASSSQYSKEIIKIHQDYAHYPMRKSNFLELLTKPYLVDDGIIGNYRIIDRNTITIREYLRSRALVILAEEEIVDLALQVLSFLIKCKNGKNLIYLGLTLDSILIDNNHHQLILSNPGLARYYQLLFWDKNGMTHIPSFSMAEMDINYKKGNVNSLSDIYVLAVIMYRLMIGINVGYQMLKKE